MKGPLFSLIDCLTLSLIVEAEDLQIASGRVCCIVRILDTSMLPRYAV
jgi:hypothetical protein